MLTPIQLALLPQWIEMCLENEDLRREFDRLYGTNTSLRGSPLELKIDEASGRLQGDAKKFVAFCVDMLERFQPPEEKP